MIAKIIKGADFGGVINYMLSKEKGKPMRSRVRSASLHAPERTEACLPHDTLILSQRCRSTNRRCDDKDCQ